MLVLLHTAFRGPPGIYMSKCLTTLNSPTVTRTECPPPPIESSIFQVMKEVPLQFRLYLLNPFKFFSARNLWSRMLPIPAQIRRHFHSTTVEMELNRATQEEKVGNGAAVPA
jgi:hypothetical protein